MNFLRSHWQVILVGLIGLVIGAIANYVVNQISNKQLLASLKDELAQLQSQSKISRLSIQGNEQMIALQIYLHEGKYYLRDDFGNFYPFPVADSSSGGAGGGGGGNAGIFVQDQGSQLPGRYKTFDFEGPGVSVVDSGGKKATITIPGYTIASLTTAQRLALNPTTALIVEDIDLDMYFKWSTVSNDWSPF